MLYVLYVGILIVNNFLSFCDSRMLRQTPLLCIKLGRRYIVYFSFDSSDILKVARSKYRISQRRCNERRSKEGKKREKNEKKRRERRCFVAVTCNDTIAFTGHCGSRATGIPRFPSRIVTSACRRELSEVDLYVFAFSLRGMNVRAFQSRGTTEQRNVTRTDSFFRFHKQKYIFLSN